MTSTHEVIVSRFYLRRYWMSFVLFEVAPEVDSCKALASLFVIVAMHLVTGAPMASYSYGLYVLLSALVHLLNSAQKGCSVLLCTMAHLLNSALKGSCVLV